MVIFHSYVSLPEGRCVAFVCVELCLQKPSEDSNQQQEEAEEERATGQVSREARTNTFCIPQLEWNPWDNFRAEKNENNHIIISWGYNNHGIHWMIFQIQWGYNDNHM